MTLKAPMRAKRRGQPWRRRRPWRGRGAVDRAIQQGTAPSAAACRTFRDQQVRLTDEIGPMQARDILRATARAWWAETGACPWCSEVGDYHGQEAAA